MLDGLREFIADIVTPHAQDRAFGDSDYRLAATALLVQAISLSAQPAAAEQRELHSLRGRQLGLERRAADRLIADATEVEGEAVARYRLTSVIMRSLGEEGRKRVVRRMWGRVYAGRKATALEDSVVWRASDLA